MKRILIITTALIMMTSGLSFADDSVPKVSSAERLTSIVHEADNEAFLTIDVKGSTADLASDELNEAAEDVLSSDASSSAKAEELASLLEESGLYEAEKKGSGTVEAVSLFANCRLRVDAGYGKVDTDGAKSAAYYEDHYLLAYEDEESTKAAYDELCEKYGRKRVLIDIPVRLSSRSWGTEMMGMESEKVRATGGADVTVAVIDSGITKDHEIFSGSTILQGHDYANDDDDPEDDNGHGTAVVGIIAEAVPANVSILPLKVVGGSEDGSSLTVLYAIKDAAESGADIINLSMGMYAGSRNDFDTLEGILDSYIGDSLLICAAGNDSDNMDDEDTHVFPAECENSVCVSAFDSSGSLSSFSNYGSAVDFSAPGRGIAVAEKSGGYKSVRGTSFAVSHITAASALIKAEEPDLDADGIRAALGDISEDMGDEGKDIYYGEGCPVFSEETSPGDGGSTDTPDAPQPVEVTPEITLSTDTLTYNGKRQIPEITVTYEGNVIEDYEVTGGGKDAGTHRITVSLTGEYRGSAEASYAIVPKSITPAISLSNTRYFYNGSERKPLVTVSDGETALAADDYEVTYHGDRVDTGTYSVSVTLKGNYEGEAETSFTIYPKTAKPVIILKESTYTYSGAAISPEIAAVRVDGKPLESSDYDADIPESTDAGKYSVSVSLKGNYSGSAETPYTINPKQIAPEVSLSRKEYRYDGTKKVPAVTAKYRGRSLSGSDVEFSGDCIQAGTYTASVSLTGNYEGSGSATFVIYKADNTISLRGKTVKIKASKLKRKGLKLKASKAMKLSGGEGRISYYKLRGNGKITVDRKTGTVKVDKKLRPGTYKIYVSATAAGDRNHSMGSKTAVIKIKVK